MEITRVPARIRVLAALALFFPLFAMLQTALAERLPYWKLDWKIFQPLLPVVGAFTLLLIWLLARGGRITRIYFTLMAAIWAVLSLNQALKGESAYYGLGLLALLCWICFYGWLLFGAYDSPYIDSGQRWFEGAPPALPKIKAGLQLGQAELGPYSVAKIGREGVYLVGPGLIIEGEKLPTSGPLRVKLQFKSKSLETEGLLIRARVMNKGSDAFGIGVQFKNPDRDLQKEIADFVESLRGEGYVP